MFLLNRFEAPVRGKGEGGIHDFLCKDGSPMGFQICTFLVAGAVKLQQCKTANLKHFSWEEDSSGKGGDGG